MNVTFRETYDLFLSTMILKVKLTSEDKMIMVYYLQLQDRVAEAVALFNTITPPKETS